MVLQRRQTVAMVYQFKVKLGIQQGTSIYESAYFSLLTTVKPLRCIGLFPTCSGVFLVIAASVLALVSRMNHHWYLQVALAFHGLQNCTLNK